MSENIRSNNENHPRKKQRTFEDTKAFVYRVAEHGGLTVNPDKEFTDHLIEGLTRNVNRYGYYACPCRDASANRKADRDICCPCVYNDDDQKDYGQCFCALFLSGKKASGAEEPGQIPERRPSHLRS